MPNSNRYFQPFLPTGNPDTTNYDPSGFSGSLQVVGEVGLAFDINERTYQRVRLDSGSTSAVPAGALEANDVIYWKDPATYTVTHDSRFAIGGQATNGYRNSVAGIARNAATAGNIIDMLIRGNNILVKSNGSGSAGATAVAGQTSDPYNNDVISVAVGTASPYRSVGLMRGEASGGFIRVDVNLTNLP